MKEDDIGKTVVEFFDSNPKMRRFKHQGHMYFCDPVDPNDEIEFRGAFPWTDHE